MYASMRIIFAFSIKLPVMASSVSSDPIFIGHPSLDDSTSIDYLDKTSMKHDGFQLLEAIIEQAQLLI